MSKGLVVGSLFLMVVLWLGAGFFIQRPQGFASFRADDKLAAFREDEDFYTYFSGSGWVKWGRTLYDNGYAEYPTLGLVYVNWPKLLTDNFNTYRVLLLTVNILFYLAVGFLTWSLAKIINGRVSNVWWLWLLPSAVYFSLNVFDIFPVFLVLLSLYLIFKQYWRSGWLVYGLAIMAKVYPVVLLPLYMFLTKEKHQKLWPFSMYALVSVIGLTLGTIWSGGWAAAVVPFGVQAARTAEPGSLLALIFFTWPVLNNSRLVVHGLAQIFQYAIPLWWFINNLLNRRLDITAQLTLAAISLLALIGFNPFYSNQWWLWVLPFLALVLPLSKIWLVVVYDLLNYLQVPIIFHLLGLYSWSFNAIVLVRSFVLIVIFVTLFKQLPKKWWAII